MKVILETVNELLTNYKYNWDNEMYVSNSHKMVMDIKRTARSHMLSHQKQITEFLSSKKLLVGQAQVKEALSDLEKKFKYYLKLFIRPIFRSRSIRYASRTHRKSGKKNRV